MFDLTLIVLARALHVMSGVAWAGATFMLASVIVPLMLRHADEGAGRWLGLAARRAGMASAGAALLTIASGIYLFVALHPHDDSLNGHVLKIGASAALLSLAVAFLVSRPAGRKLGQLQMSAVAGESRSAQVEQERARLRRRMAISTRVAAALLGLSILAMATFRYAGAFS
jgi:uncharacterized membrane protein